eukprot:1137391-Pelagomonas_calceolata.AAC.1
MQSGYIAPQEQQGTLQSGHEGSGCMLLHSIARCKGNCALADQTCHTLKVCASARHCALQRRSAAWFIERAALPTAGCGCEHAMACSESSWALPVLLQTPLPRSVEP